MKTKLICLIALCLCIQITSAQQNTVTLTGKLINFANEVEVEDMSEFNHLNPPAADHIITPDAGGKFTIKFSLAEPNYFRIGRNILYLSPGDNMQVTIYKDKPTNSSFKGPGQDANKYLRETPFPKAGSYLEAGKNIDPEPKGTFDAIMIFAKDRQEDLSSLTNVSPEFKRLEATRIKADVLNSFKQTESYAKNTNVISYYPFVYAQMLNKIAANTRSQYQRGLVDASLMKLVVYRDIAKDLIAGEPENAQVLKIKDFFKASDLIDKIDKGTDKAQLNGYYKDLEDIKTPEYNAAAKAYLQSKLQFGKGDLAVDFTAVNLSGKKVNLADLKGKVIYVDLWATWCGPCLDEMPKLEELKDQYRGNPNIVFVSLSIDDDNQLERWRQNISGRGAKGYQWQINRTKLAAYNVTNIPRTLLIDKNFKIFSINAELPSSRQLTTDLDKLLLN